MIEDNNFPLLRIGSTSESVKILQEKLKILGYYSGSITGSFGPSTEIAVADFQAQNNLTATGITDKTTWELLYNLTNTSVERQNKPTIRLESTGEYVMELQKQLKQILYYNGLVNGIFDKETELAVKMFQANNKLTADGIVGSATWSALTYLYAPLAICKKEEESFYIVRSGDSLYSIAKRFNLTIDEIKRLNGLTSDTIFVGQKLFIIKESKPETNDSYYVVKSGDTLYSIAKRFNTTVDEIKRLNNLASNTIFIGQKLFISSMPGFYYIVKSGDTLYSIARKYNTTVERIKSINNLTSNTISIGQKLLV